MCSLRTFLLFPFAIILCLGAVDLGAHADNPAHGSVEFPSANGLPDADSALPAWTSGGPYGGHVSSLDRSTRNSDIMYAGTAAGIYKSRDAGRMWVTTNFPSKIAVRVVRLAPSRPETIYAGTDIGIYKSADGGATWANKGFRKRINAIAVHPLNPSRVLAGTGRASFLHCM